MHISSYTNLDEDAVYQDMDGLVFYLVKESGLGRISDVVTGYERIKVTTHLFTYSRYQMFYGEEESPTRVFTFNFEKTRKSELERLMGEGPYKLSATSLCGVLLDLMKGRV